jgi:hypothetical protein
MGLLEETETAGKDSKKTLKIPVGALKRLPLSQRLFVTLLWFASEKSLMGVFEK